jgi:AcrR family transcriptional regulator
VADSPRTQVERTAQARRRLLRAAIKLLAERGYTGTTLAEIGRAAGLSRGLVTHHFGTKDACIEAAVDEIHRAAQRTFTGEAGLRGLARIDHLVDTYLASAHEDQYYIRAMYVVMADSISEAPSLREAVGNLNEMFRSQLEIWLEQAVADGEVAPGLDLHAASVVIQGMLRGVVLQWFVDPERVDFPATIKAARAMVRAALARPGG